MAFEAYPKSDLDTLQEFGIFYVREKGRLFAPPGYAPSSDTDHDNQHSEEHFYPIEATLCQTTKLHNAPSLLHICTDFVADRIKHVDSFVGFPVLIAESLYRRVLKRGILDTINEESKCVLRKFSDAYGDLICSSFVMRNTSVFLTNCADVLMECFPALHVLELRGCKLGDSHDLLNYISELNSLLKLGLSLNALSDRGLQKLTTPLRMFQRGPLNLEVLDISDNPDVTDGVVRSIIAFPALLQLDLTRTRITNAGVAKLEQKTRLVKKQLGAIGDKPSLLGDARMEGWATDTLKRWIDDAHPFKNQSPMSILLTQPKHMFYGVHRKRIDKVKKFAQKEILREEKILRSLNQEALIFEADEKKILQSNTRANIAEDFNSDSQSLSSAEKKTKSPDNHGKRKAAKRFSYKDTINMVSTDMENNPVKKSSKRKSSDDTSTSSKKSRLLQMENPLKSENTGLENFSDDEQYIMRGYLQGSTSRGNKKLSLLDALSE